MLENVTIDVPPARHSHTLSNHKRCWEPQVQTACENHCSALLRTAAMRQLPLPENASPEALSPEAESERQSEREEREAAERRAAAEAE